MDIIIDFICNPLFNFILLNLLFLLFVYIIKELNEEISEKELERKKNVL